VSSLGQIQTVDNDAMKNEILNLLRRWNDKSAGGLFLAQSSSLKCATIRVRQGGPYEKFEQFSSDESSTIKKTAGVISRKTQGNHELHSTAPPCIRRSCDEISLRLTLIWLNVARRDDSTSHTVPRAARSRAGNANMQALRL